MGALPRPDVTPGPQRDLVDALHRLHHHAGWPSLRALARGVGCSPTTVSGVFSRPRLPTWGVLELLVEAMNGDVEEFRDLWLAAGSTWTTAGQRSRIAGRKEELALLRQHLVGGSRRLLLVTGEAGIGKSRLVRADEASDQVRVIVGPCLRLSNQVPLLPIAEVLRSASAWDEGRALTQAVAECPPYVAGALARLLPEIGDLADTGTGSDGAWERQRLFAAVRAVFAALGAQNGWAVLIEDLHWADSATLDLLEQLLAVTDGTGLPVVGTYRTEDPETPPATEDWFHRMRRSGSVDVLEMAMLDQDETREQLRLLGQTPGPDLLERIHHRAQGNPLFVEQLALHSAGDLPEDQPLPGLLSDLLDRRLEGLGTSGWSVARVLGLGDRPLEVHDLVEAADVGEGQVIAGLHELDERRLLRPRSGPRQVELRHPLLAEAIRRRMVPGEAPDVHRRLAKALALSGRPAAAEIAAHWQGADDAEQELVWRIAAARSAQERFALAQEAGEWRRALELWPDVSVSAGAPPVRKIDAYLAAMDALTGIDVSAAAALSRVAMHALGDARGLDAAEVYQRSAAYLGVLGDPEQALMLLDEAQAIYEVAAPSRSAVDALLRRVVLTESLGRPDDAASATRAAGIAAGLDDPGLHRQALAVAASQDAVGGDLESALRRIETASQLDVSRPDPGSDVAFAIRHTDVLMTAGQPVDSVVAAGRQALDAAHAWGLETVYVDILRANIAEALIRAGRVDEAAHLIDPTTDGRPSLDRRFAHGMRARLDGLRGRTDAATERFDALGGFPIVHLRFRVRFVEQLVSNHLWCGRPRAALDNALTLLRDTSEAGSVADIGGVLALAGRAAADLAESGGVESAARRELVEQMEQLTRDIVDPFGPRPASAAHPALEAMWRAEMGRLATRPSLEGWAAAAVAWDRLGRPYDAAYCRWRAGELGRRTGVAGRGARILLRAARDARGHVPLLAAILETMPRPPSGAL